MNQDSARPVVGARPLEENQSEGENSWPGEVAHESVCVQECVLYLCFSKQCLLIYSQVQNKAVCSEMAGQVNRENSLRGSGVGRDKA